MRRPSRAAAGLTLLLWIVAGPLAVVFGACAVMMCEGPCGVGPCAVLVLVALTPILFIVGTTVPIVRPVPTALARLVDPPPRGLLLTA